MNQRTAEKIYETALLISRIALMNILWLIFVVLGAGIFGVLPATVTLYSVFRRSYQDQGEFKWWPYAWREYFFYLKKLFFISLILVFICFSLVLSYYTLGQQHILFNRLILAFLIYIAFLVVPNFAVNLVHLDVPLGALLKNSLLLPFFWGGTSFKILATFLGSAVLCYLVPGIIPVFAIAVPSYITCNTLLKRWDKQLTALETSGGDSGA